MVVKIITDSLGDIPETLVRELGITVIPINVLFGTQSFRDGVDLTTEQFYDKLVKSKIVPTTAVPALGAFADVYDKAAEKANEILVLTLSHKLSGTFDTACHAAEIMKKKARVQVIDTLQVIMGEGMVVIAAARAAKSGAKIEEIVAQVQRNLARVEARMCFDTLEYLKRGGRIGAGKAFLGSILKLNPVLALKDGEVQPITRERSRTRAIDHLYNHVASYKDVDSIAVEDATTPVEADVLAGRLAARFPGKPLYRSKVSPVIGAHVGPSVIAVSVLGDK
jgi:DegV family protein with EDD domain